MSIYCNLALPTLFKKKWYKPEDMSLHVVCGPMFSGKSTELQRRLRRFAIAGKRTLAITHALDSRYDTSSCTDRPGMVTHDKRMHVAIRTECLTATCSPELLDSVDVIAVDEGQFYESDDLIVFVKTAMRSQKIVLIAALDGNYLREPYPHVCALCALATTFTKLSAVCVRCGSDAPYSHRTIVDDAPVLIGAETEYEALCYLCFEAAIEKK